MLGTGKVTKQCGCTLPQHCGKDRHLVCQAVHNAFQGGVGIKKRADKRQRFYVHSRSLTVKQKNSKRLSKKKEKQSAESPRKKKQVPSVRQIT